MNYSLKPRVHVLTLFPVGIGHSTEKGIECTHTDWTVPYWTVSWGGNEALGGGDAEAAPGTQPGERARQHGVDICLSTGKPQSVLMWLQMCNLPWIISPPFFFFLELLLF